MKVGKKHHIRRKGAGKGKIRKNPKYLSPLEKTLFTGKRYCWGCGKKLESRETYCGKCGSFNY